MLVSFRRQWDSDISSFVFCKIRTFGKFICDVWHQLIGFDIIFIFRRRKQNKYIQQWLDKIRKKYKKGSKKIEHLNSNVAEASENIQQPWQKPMQF